MNDTDNDPDIDIIEILTKTYKLHTDEDNNCRKTEYFNDILIDKSLELEGTITGEHGIGLHKKSYLLKEHPDNLPVMKSIKRTMDPNNIMNPGKIFDLN